MFDKVQSPKRLQRRGVSSAVEGVNRKKISKCTENDNNYQKGISLVVIVEHEFSLLYNHFCLTRALCHGADFLRFFFLCINGTAVDVQRPIFKFKCPICLHKGSHIRQGKDF